MWCPYCKSDQTKVVDKRDNEDTNTTRRRRECESCTKRFTTYERIEKVLLNVIKRDGRIEEFNRQKIKDGIMKAVKKRSIPEDAIEQIISGVENELIGSDNTNIRSVEIGDLILAELTKIDKLGALLFAAVYREFQSLEDVQKELERLEKKGKR
jgi:transcriptional repressor NrdR